VKILEWFAGMSADGSQTCPMSKKKFGKDVIRGVSRISARIEADVPNTN